MKNKNIRILIILAIAIIFIQFVSAESFSSTSVSNPRYYSSSSTFTGSSGFEFNNLISGINAPENEEEFYDLMVTILPGGCKPMVVRSDLLEEQNVPVFCELTAVKINPGVDISKIARVSVKNKDNNQYIAGVGFYPARAAIRSTTNLVNSPVTNNIGYAVIVLKRTETENAMPSNIAANLSAMFEYDASNGFGIGVNELYLPVMSDDEFMNRQKEFGFFNGVGYLRVDSMDQNSAVVSIYDSQNRKLFSQRLEKDITSREFRIPTSVFSRSYENQALTLTLKEITMPQTSAKIVVNDGSYVVYKNGKFADKCTLTNVVSSGGGTGTATVNCGGKTVTLEKKFNKINLVVNGAPGDYAWGDKISALNDKKIQNYYLVYAGNVPNDKVTDPSKKTFIFLAKEKSGGIITIEKSGQITKDIERQIKKINKADYYGELEKIKSSSLFSSNELILVYQGKEAKDKENSTGIIFKDAKFENVALASALGGTEEYYNKAKNGYDDVESKFPNEKNNYDALGKTGETFGTLSLWSKYEMAYNLNQQQDVLEILSEIRNSYPNSKNVFSGSGHNGQTAEQIMAETDNLLSSEGASTFIEDQNLYLELVSVNEPAESEASVQLTYSGITSSETTTRLAVGTPLNDSGEATLSIGERLSSTNGFSFTVKNITADSFNISYSCTSISSRELILPRSSTPQLVSECGVQIIVKDIIFNASDTSKSKISLKIEGKRTIPVRAIQPDLKKFSFVSTNKDSTGNIIGANVKYECEKEIITDSLGTPVVEGREITACGIKIIKIEENNITITYRLSSATSIPETSSTKTEIGTEQVIARQGEKFIDLGEGKLQITLKSFTADKAIFTYSCNNSVSTDIDIKKGSTDILSTCGNAQIRVEKINLQEVAKVELNPKIKGRIREANFTFSIGIEKRSDFLLPSPEEMNKQIKDLDEKISQWKNATEKLGTLVKGMKAACLATSGALTLKNWATGLTGEASARHEVMTRPGGWNDICKEEIAAKRYTTENECFQDKNSVIEQSVEETSKLMNDYQKAEEARIKANKNATKGVTDYNKVKEDQLNTLKSSYSGTIKVLGQDGKEKEVNIGEVLKNMNLSEGDASSIDLRELDLNLQLMNSNVDESLKKSASKKVENLLSQFDGRSKDREGARKATEIFGLPAGLIGEPLVDKNSVQRPYSIKKWSDYSNELQSKGLTLPAGETIDATGMVEVIPYGANSYLYVLAGAKDNIHTERIFKLSQNASTGKSLVKVFDATKGTDELKDLNQLKNVRFKLYDAATYKNPCKNCNYAEVFNSEPYKGMPSLLPFDEAGGWYVSIRQNIPTFGNLKSYQDSGALSSFYLCNVGKNGMMEDQVGDDICQNFNINTADANIEFSGLTASETKKRLTDANNAIRSAQDQLAKNPSIEYITINRMRLKVKGVQGTAGGKCTDFMSAKDCNIMFNVCDPVVCPSSRCDMGGNYRVDNVIQSGIIGSIALCLPNFKEGIFIPVCLSGIYAGMEGWVSIMQAHRDCLNESLATNKTVGICDEIYSVYQCDFMWKQIGPYANALAKNALSGTLFGAGTKGGGEYMFVNQAFSNAENSWQYFTSSYASDSKLSFGARSFSEIGSDVCKAKLSSTYPDVFGTALEPDSPVQIYAFFDEMTYTDATAPSTSQYKVYYHIFAGNDQGHYYQVYLRSSAASFGVTSRGYSNIASGYITKGETVDQTKDFLDNSGFKELCVRIDTKDYCGFKSVTTDFAINYAKDKAIQDQANNNGVETEKECVSGSPSLGSFITPNIQQGAEGLISPEIYNQGVIRVCASQNPGAGVSPARWIEVGFCDNTNIKCWVDQNSVKNAIKGQGIENSTLQQIDALNIQNMIDAGMMTSAGGNASIEEIIKNYPLLKDSFSPSSYANMEKDVGSAYDKMIFSSQKAALLYHKAMVYDTVARLLGKTGKLVVIPVVPTTAVTSTTADISAKGFIAPSGEIYYILSDASVLGASFEIVGVYLTSGGNNLTMFNDPSKQPIDVDVSKLIDVTLIKTTSSDGKISYTLKSTSAVPTTPTSGTGVSASYIMSSGSISDAKMTENFQKMLVNTINLGWTIEVSKTKDSAGNYPLRAYKDGSSALTSSLLDKWDYSQDKWVSILPTEAETYSSSVIIRNSADLKAVFGIDSTTLTVAPPAVDSEETILLAKMMWAEERSEGDEAMKAAGWVAVNRVGKPREDYSNKNFPGTLKEVLQANGQFSKAFTGFDNPPDAIEQAAKDDALRIARGILKNDPVYGDNTQGSIYFVNSVSSTVLQYFEDCKTSIAQFNYLKIGKTMIVSNKYCVTAHGAVGADILH